MKRSQTVLNWPISLTEEFERDAEMNGFTRTSFVAHLYGLWKIKVLRSRKLARPLKRDGRPRLRSLRDEKD